MKKFWLEIRQQVVELGQLLRKIDTDNKLVWGSNSHRFGIHPVVSEEEIRLFEVKHNTLLPENYRTFLQYFGAGGAGPDLGINRFPEAVWQGDLSKPLNLNFYPNLDFSNGYAETENVDGPLFDLDGMLRIGNAGQAQNYLVVSGTLDGNVLCWDRWDGLGWLSGPFDVWYKNWVESIYHGLSENEAIDKIQEGMNLSEIISIPNLNIEYRFNKKNILYFKYNEVWVELDSDNNVCRISKRPYPIGHGGGFRCWSESKCKYVG